MIQFIDTQNEPLTREEFEDIKRRADKGERAAIREMRAFLDRHPEIVQELGDLARTTEGIWLRLIAPSEKLAQESIHRLLEELKDQLREPGDTALVEMLI